jgi:hypothetical protein
MPTLERLPRGNRRAERALGIILLARAAAAFSLARWLTVDTPGWRDVFQGIATYALVDGALALVTGTLLAAAHYRGRPAVLIAMTFVDAAVRLGLGVTIIKLPAIAELPMTVVPLFGVVGATAAFFGGVAILSWAVAHHRRQREHSVAYEALFDPIPVIALVSIVIGTRLIIDPPTAAEQLRPLVAMGGLGVAIGFAVASAGSLIEGFRPRERFAA